MPTLVQEPQRAGMISRGGPSSRSSLLGRGGDAAVAGKLLHVCAVQFTGERRERHRMWCTDMPGCAAQRV